MFLSIYLHLFARMVVTYPTVGWPLLLLVVLLGGASHSVQSSLADYYRNAYLKFVVDPSKSELEAAADVREEFASIRFMEHPVKKTLLRIYLNYTTQQETFSPKFQALRTRVASQFGQNVPEWFRDEYRRMNKPLMKYYAILTTNTRMIVMSVAVLCDKVPIYFAVEILVINLIMVLVTMHQEKLSAVLLSMIDRQKVTA
jgi:hypothetical protein